MLGLSATQLDFLDGMTEELPAGGVVVIVGPNNAGKSVLLDGIRRGFVEDPMVQNARWLRAVTVERDSDETHLAEWFKRRARTAPQGTQWAGQPAITSNTLPNAGTVVPWSQVQEIWHRSPTLGHLAQYLVADYGAMSRGGLLNPAGVRDPMITPTHPLHRMWDDRDLEDRFSALVRRAFGFDISINRYALNNLQLLVGRTGMPDEVFHQVFSRADNNVRQSGHRTPPAPGGCSPHFAHLCTLHVRIVRSGPTWVGQR